LGLSKGIQMGVFEGRKPCARVIFAKGDSPAPQPDAPPGVAGLAPIERPVRQ